MLETLFGRDKSTQEETILNEKSFWFEEEPKYKRPARKRVNKLAQSKNTMLKELLQLLKDTEGRPVNLAKLSRQLGYRSPSSLTELLRTLEKAGAAVRVGGAPGGWIFRVAPEGTPTTIDRSFANSNKTKDIGAYRRAVGQANRKKVLDFITRHQGQFLTLGPIAQAGGISRTVAERHIQALIEDGKLEVSAPVPGYGRRFRVPGNSNVPDNQEGPNLEALKTEEKHEVPKVTESVNSSNEDKFIEIYEELLWEFIKTTRSTDALLMLTWLEERKK